MNHSGPTGLKINPGGSEEQPPSPRISAGLHSAPPRPARGCPPWAPSPSCGIYRDTRVCLHIVACTCAYLQPFAHACMRMGACKHVHSCVCLHTCALAHTRQCRNVHKRIRTPMQRLATQAHVCMCLHTCVHLKLCARALAELAHTCTHLDMCFHALEHPCAWAHLHTLAQTHARGCIELHKPAAHTCKVHTHACTLLHAHTCLHTRGSVLGKPGTFSSPGALGVINE